MSWNYRVVQYAEGEGYGLHEVYYDGYGKEKAMSSSAIGFVSDSEEGVGGIVSSLERALSDARNRPVFVPPDSWGKTNG